MIALSSNGVYISFAGFTGRFFAGPLSLSSLTFCTLSAVTFCGMKGG